MLRRLLIASILVLPAFADESAKTKVDDVKTPKNVSLADSPEVALKKFAVSPGLKVEVWAAEPLLANPVALGFDHKGRAFVAETYRRRTSVPDIRKNEEWTIANLALRTVDQRIQFLKGMRPESAKAAPTNSNADLNADGQFDWRDWTVESEQVRLVFDSDGDGKADQSRVFASGFNSLPTGVAAGIAAHGDDVYFTVTPDLWKIDSQGRKTALHSGFGVHVAYSGHDMHGVKIGPDGRVYWSIADCGAHVKTKEGGVIDIPDTGAVFRCDPDGTNLEVVATGLRNPQSLAWNELGDLFTGDNNADGGDKARWEHIVEGGDYGWTIGWQFLPKLGAWNTDGMWKLDANEHNLAVLPPVGHIGHGPAGIAYYPGTGLPEDYRDHFFYADFPGGVRTFRLKAKGASYTVDNPDDVLLNNSPQEMDGKILWGLFPSDVGFAPGGGLYVLDWVHGWEKTGKGRIFRLFDPAADQAARETKELLGAGFLERAVDELVTLLGHDDQRVRLGAQFELVRRGDPKPLIQAALARGRLLARIHAIWGVAQLARKSAGIVQPLMPLAIDTEDEVRAQWAKCVGEGRFLDQAELVQRLLTDKNPRVQFFAAQALGHLRTRKAALPLAKVAAAADRDPHLRHAAILALARCGGESEAIQTGGETALLALRILRSPKVASFLESPSSVTPAVPHVRSTAKTALVPAAEHHALALEAARAIHDLPISPAWPQLARLAEHANLPEALTLRALNANYLLGSREAAERVGRISANANVAEHIRLFALESLPIWNAPFGRDRITGLWRDLPPRTDASAAPEVAARIIPPLLNDKADEIRRAAAELAGSLKTLSVEPALYSLATDTKSSGGVRAAALRSLRELQSVNLASAVAAALAQKDSILLETARDLAEAVSPDLAVQVNADLLGKAGTREQQAALATIARQPGTAADDVISAQLDRLAAGKLPKSLHLDVLEAAAHRTSESVKSKLVAYEQSRKGGDPISFWRECLEGGDSKLGREIFNEKAEAACLRCHKMKGTGGDVGPELAGIGAKQDRESILRAIVDPNATIAPGYENVLLTLTDGKTLVAGLLVAEDAASVTVKSLIDGTTQNIAKTNLKERTTVPSAMPPGLGEVLGKRALRHVVEFLAKAK